MLGGMGCLSGSVCPGPNSCAGPCGGVAGQLSEAEIVRGFETLGAHSPEQARKLFHSLDTGADEKVDFAEFCRLYANAQVNLTAALPRGSIVPRPAPLPGTTVARCSGCANLQMRTKSKGPIVFTEQELRFFLNPDSSTMVGAWVDGLVTQDLSHKGKKFAFLPGLVAGGLAGAVTKTSVAPLERVKMLMQVGSTSSASGQQYTGMVSAIRGVLKNEGVLAFWKGNTTNCVRIVPTSAANWLAYDTFKTLLLDESSEEGKKGKLSVQRNLAAGGLSGACSLAVTYPLDLARTRITTSTTAQCDVDATETDGWWSDCRPCSFRKAIHPASLCERLQLLSSRRGRV